MAVTHHTIAIEHVHNVLQGARRQGVDVAALLERAGITPAVLDAPMARVAQPQYAQLLSALRGATGDELWGLCRDRLPIGSFAQCCRLLIHTHTLGAALRTGFRFFHGLVGDFVPRLQVEGGVARVRLDERRQDPDAPLDYAERTFVFFSYMLACWLVARRVPLLGVDYKSGPHSIPADTVRLFLVPLDVGRPQAGFRFEARWLDLPVVQNEQSLREFLRQVPASLLIKYRDQASITERIRRLLRSHLQREMLSLDEVSRLLAMTPQTLRRRLRDEGQGFQALKDDLRRDAAIELLARPDMTLAEIAAQLGFSEASTFHRAFKGWTGVAPGEYRSSHGPVVPIGMADTAIGAALRPA